jgi:acetolactate synthase regulatory subunit
MRKRSTASTAFGIVDLALAVLYSFLVLRVVPSRSSTFTVVAMTTSTVLAAGGVGMIVQSRLGLVVAAVAASSMVTATFALILLLVASAAYLHGIYDGIGQAGVALAILAALLAIEVVGLVPALQLVHLWRRRREGR